MATNPASGVPARIFELLEKLSTRPSHFFELKGLSKPSNGTPTNPVDSISVSPPKMINSSTIAVVVSQGQKDSHRFATRPNKKKKKNLEGHSAEVEHFVSFHFPTDDEGTSFLLVSQTFRRKDVVKRLLQVLALTSLEVRREEEEREKAERKALRAAGADLPGKKDLWRFAFERRQANDDDYIDDILGAAKSVSATFTAAAPSERGGEAGAVEKTLTIKFTTDAIRDSGRAISRRWTKLRRENKSMTQAQGIQELFTELDAHGVLTTEDVSEYDKSRINVHAGIASATIAVDTLKDVFTYPVHKGKPDALFFFQKVHERLNKIAKQEDIELSQINPAEVAECLADSA
jgi:hypothetical protein